MLNEQYDTFIRTLDSEDVQPTQPQRQVFEYLHGELETALAQWRAVVDSDLPAFESLMRAHAVPSLTDARAP